MLRALCDFGSVIRGHLNVKYHCSNKRDYIRIQDIRGVCNIQDIGDCKVWDYRINMKDHSRLENIGHQTGKWQVLRKAMEQMKRIVGVNKLYAYENEKIIYVIKQLSKYSISSLVKNRVFLCRLLYVVNLRDLMFQC